MAWLDELQVTLGSPVVAFLQAHWVPLLILAGCGLFVLFASASRGGYLGTELTLFFGTADADGSGDSGDGGDGGGGD